jgi:hypothetical protein
MPVRVSKKLDLMRQFEPHFRNQRKKLTQKTHISVQ